MYSNNNKFCLGKIHCKTSCINSTFDTITCINVKTAEKFQRKLTRPFNTPCTKQIASVLQAVTNDL